MRETALILFTRIPVAGRVKTRLMPHLSGEDCAALQQAMTLDTARTLTDLDADLYIFHSDEGPISLLNGLPPQSRLFPQTGPDLGARMQHALETVLALGYVSCLLLGADLPFLTGADVMAAVEALSGNDVVLCPSPDGGYWLVGLHHPFPPLFTGQKYGTGSVFSDAITCCEKHGLRTALGPVQSDLDTPADLAEVLTALQNDDIPRGNTVDWLRAWQKRRLF